MRTVNTVKRKTRSERACPQSDPGAAPRPQGVQKSCFTFILRIRALPKDSTHHKSPKDQSWARGSSESTSADGDYGKRSFISGGTSSKLTSGQIRLKTSNAELRATRRETDYWTRINKQTTTLTYRSYETIYVHSTGQNIHFTAFFKRISHLKNMAQYFNLIVISSLEKN